MTLMTLIWVWAMAFPGYEFRKPSSESITALSIPESERAMAGCYLAYQKLFRNPTLKIRILFGYKDARPARFVGDRYERLIVTERLQRDCDDGDGACGFKRDAKNRERFTRTVKGPDGKEREVELRLIDSSAGPDDEENRKDPFQKVRSSSARQQFLEGMGEADIVFYNGHSRNGGGPDFDPPRLKPNLYVDFPHYLKERPGKKELIEALRKSATGPVILGLFSCVSEKHFSDEIKKAKPAMGLISQSSLLYSADSVKGMLGALSALLTMQCEKEIDSAMNAESISGTSKLENFF